MPPTYLGWREERRDEPQPAVGPDGTTGVGSAGVPPEWMPSPETVARMPVHAADCALNTTHHLTCTCGHMYVQPAGCLRCGCTTEHHPELGCLDCLAAGERCLWYVQPAGWRLRLRRRLLGLLTRHV